MGGSGRALRDAHPNDGKTVVRVGHPDCVGYELGADFEGVEATPLVDC